MYLPANHRSRPNIITGREVLRLLLIRTGELHSKTAVRHGVMVVRIATTRAAGVATVRHRLRRGVTVRRLPAARRAAWGRAPRADPAEGTKQNLHA